MPDNFTIRPLTYAEMSIPLSWAAREGWNPGLDDADPFWHSDPESFFGGFIGDNPAAVISAVRYGDHFGFLGFYIVAPDYRGQGYGYRIWQHALRRLHGRNIGLDGVVAQQGNYGKSGFISAHRNVRYQGSTALPATQTGVGSALARPLGQIPFETLATYDRRFFPADRTTFLSRWVVQPHAHALGITHGDMLTGYGVIRQCQSGFKIAPLFADDVGEAEALLRAMASRVPAGEPLFLDVPACNLAAASLAERMQMTAVFETIRMYTGPEPDVSVLRTYGLTSFEIG